MARKRSSGKSVQPKSYKGSQPIVKNVEQGLETERFDYKSHCKIETRTEAQRSAMKLFHKSDYLFLIGPAGVGKSFIATSLAIKETINYNVGKIVLTRPVIEAEETLGFLPGTFEDKINPYLVPLYDQFDEVFDERSIAKQFEKQFVHIAPLAYMRGRTFNNSICILDEAQNCTYGQMKLYLTRLGKNSKMIITGDPNQCDVKNSGLMDVIDRCKHRSSVGVIIFENSDNVRHPAVENMLIDLG